MKTILLIFALLFAHQSIAVAPYGFKGQDQTATQYSNVLKFKNRSVVKTGGINSLVEDQDNLLYNGGFEATPDLDGWTCVGAGSSFTVESKPVSASVVISGDRTLAIGCATVGGCTCTQDFSVNQQQIGRSVLLSGIVRTSSDVQGLKLTYRENGADTSVTTENVLNGIPATEAVIGSSATTIGIKLTIPYSATPTTVRVDEIKMAYGTAVTNQPAIGQRVAYTPTFTGFGVVTNINCYGQQVGSNELVDCTFTTGTASGVEARVGLRPGITIAPTIPAISFTGGTARSAVGGAIFNVLKEPNVSYVTFSAQGAANASLTKITDTTIGTGVTLSFQALVPIAQYASSVPTYTGRCNDPRACENVFSAKVSSGGVVSDENLDWINGNCVISGTSLATCTYSASLVTTPMNCTATVSTIGASARTAQIESNLTSSIAIRIREGATAVAQDFNISCQRQGQDYINAKTLQQNVALKSYVQTPSTTGRVGFCSAKISATGVISDQLGGCFASCTNATTPVCTFTSNYWKSGSVPNCWFSADGGYNLGATSTTSTSYSGQLQLAGTGASGPRFYFCHGEIQ